MDKKYTSDRPSDILPRIITSDVYCAACLLSLGCSLDKVVKNNRRRVAFVFTGERVREFKRAFKEADPVYVVAQSFRDALITVRRLVDHTLSERSESCPPQTLSRLEPPVLSQVEVSPMR